MLLFVCVEGYDNDGVICVPYSWRTQHNKTQLTVGQRGLAYLHTADKQNPLVHRDVKR